MELIKCKNCPSRREDYSITMKMGKIVREMKCDRAIFCMSGIPTSINQKIEEVVTLGADPEFELWMDGGVVSVTDFDGEGNEDLTCSSEIGVDGSGNQIELRPEPATTPKDLVLNFADLLQRCNYQLNILEQAYTLGGHIHIGSKKPHIMTNAEPIFRKLHSRFVKIWRWLDGPIRRESSYAAHRNTYRTSDYPDGSVGMEYRQPPASIFANPKALEIALKLILQTVTGKQERQITRQEGKFFSQYVQAFWMLNSAAKSIPLVQDIFFRDPYKLKVTFGWGLSDKEKAKFKELEGMESCWPTIKIIGPLQNSRERWPTFKHEDSLEYDFKRIKRIIEKTSVIMKKWE